MDVLCRGHGGGTDGGEIDGWLADSRRGRYRTGRAAEEEGMDHACKGEVITGREEHIG